MEGAKPRAGGPRRGYRRIEWIERVLAPLRNQLSRKDFDRLVSAVSVLIGWEPLIILKDIRGIEQKDAEEALAFAARAVVQAALSSGRERD